MVLIYHRNTSYDRFITILVSGSAECKNMGGWLLKKGIMLSQWQPQCVEKKHTISTDGKKAFDQVFRFTKFVYNSLPYCSEISEKRFICEFVKEIDTLVII